MPEELQTIDDIVSKLLEIKCWDWDDEDIDNFINAAI